MRTNLRELRRALALGVVAVLTPLVCAVAALAQASEGDSETTGHLIAFSNPSGAYVYIDGLLLGQTPLRSIALTPGTYSIWFRTKPPLTFEPEPLPERTFTVVAGDSILIQEDMGSIVRLESAPANAEITIGGRPMGRTPLEFRWHRARSGEVRVALQGFRSRRIEHARLTEGGNVRVRLTPLGAVTDLGGELEIASSSSRFNWPAWGSLAVGAAAAGLAVHFKSEADDSYDQYLESAVSSEQERFLDDSNRLDRLSAVSWVVAEGGFLAALWFFAREVLAIENVPTPVLRHERRGTSMGFEVRY